MVPASVSFVIADLARRALCGRWRCLSADDAGEEDDDHRPYGCGRNAAGGLIANAEINAKSLQKKAADERPSKPGDHVVEKTRAAHEPACQPSCHDPDPGLGSDGSLVQGVKGLPVHTDADRQP